MQTPHRLPMEVLSLDIMKTQWVESSKTHTQSILNSDRDTQEVFLKQLSEADRILLQSKLSTTQCPLLYTQAIGYTRLNNDIIGY